MNLVLLITPSLPDADASDSRPVPRDSAPGEAIRVIRWSLPAVGLDQERVASRTKTTVDRTDASRLLLRLTQPNDHCKSL